jgi:hypothetical protein
MEYQARLDTFREGIVEGAHELVARHLYRGGVYQASLDNGLARNPDSSMVLSSLANRLSSADPDAYEFYSENKNLVEQQGQSLDAETLLRGVLRHKGKATGLLEGNVLRELSQAQILIQRMKRLDEYLATWKESLRMEGSVELQKIVDMHS